jgi:hypothetical protein
VLRASSSACSALVVALSACAQPPTTPTAVEVVSFEPGEYAGFGADKMPDVVLGAPSAKNTSAGSLDVVSLGLGGSIVLRFEPPLLDVRGSDVVIYENAFYYAGSSDVFSEPGEVAFSEDGTTFYPVVCTPENNMPNGCAGMTPALATATNGFAGVPGDVLDGGGGGDAFDLADVGLLQAAFVRIVDRTNSGAGTSAGFDLDAVVAVVPSE